MNPFHDNPKLEQIAMYAIDWGIFLRHDLEDAVIPYLHLWNGDELMLRALMTDEDPVEFAKSILANETKPYTHFAIGMEGYLRSGQDESSKQDAIIIQAFDAALPEGVALGQMFVPKEQGGFSKQDKINYLGSPSNPLAENRHENPSPEITDTAFVGASAIGVNGTKTIGNISHPNPSVVVNALRHLLRNKLGGENGHEHSGEFEIRLSSREHGSDPMLTFLALTAIDEEEQTAYAKTWSETSGKAINIKLTVGDELVLDEQPSQLTDADSQTLQDALSEFNTTQQATPDPIEERSTPTAQNTKKPWWKFW